MFSSSEDKSETIPVTIVTGFLGSGKTTLLNDLLRDPAFAGSAVLINEFGDVQIDHDLVADFTDELVITTTGCICCTASSDIKQSLFDLWQKHESGETGPVNRVIVESTGLMDPVPVVNSLLLPPIDNPLETVVRQRFLLSRVITLFDIIFGPMTLEQNEEAIKQVALADAILLTKTDLARDPATLRDMASDRNQLSRLNRGATILDRQKDWESIRNLFLKPVSYNLRGKDEDVIAWLDADRIHQSETHNHDHHEHKNMDITRHGEDIRSHVIFLNTPIANDRFSHFLTFLKADVGTDLMRIKGIFLLCDDPEHPVIVHGIQHTVYPVEKLERWPNSDRRTKVVLIGRNLDPDKFGELLEN